MKNLLQTLWTDIGTAIADRQRSAPNRLFIYGPAVLALLTLCYIAISIVIAPGDTPTEQFEEGGTITALSSIYLAMAAAAATVTFYMVRGQAGIQKYFWLIAGLGLAFLSLDELVQIHERIDVIVSGSSVGESTTFRNWNDLVVILYGAVALGVGLMFLPEVLRYRYVFEAYLVGALFFVVHTAIDSLTAIPTTTSVVFEESAKLMCGMCILIASSASSAAVVDNARNRIAELSAQLKS